MSRMPLIAVMLCLAGAADAGVFKCKDKTGAVVYSEQPCEKAGVTGIKELSKADLKGNEVRARQAPPPKPGELAPLVPPGGAKGRPGPDQD